MAEFLIISFFIAFFVAYIYFGYYQDYKKNPTEFIRSIIGMPLGMLASTLGFKSIDKKLKNWANKKIGYP
ncbi:hypothetical protein [Zunongwangia pacifica]|uniref:Uncharacterized protein n=1 Tax=Zunongwangia pacifica TaxID=2911062 RepID=A0A9X2CL14_9FLAO|nr:hypothetical protein [Zunongwangia pacifica]MCL6219526.1 hypothetical protein [Zunongwangia pacifica]